MGIIIACDSIANRFTTSSSVIGVDRTGDPTISRVAFAGGCRITSARVSVIKGGVLTNGHALVTGRFGFRL